MIIRFFSTGRDFAFVPEKESMKNTTEFKKEISECRTFSFLHELEMLLENGLIKGGDLNNAIVYVDKEISTETMERLKQ